MRYLALLRGINVGTAGRIRMDALIRLMEETGFTQVSTYIQSGNILFESSLSEQHARERIEQTLKDRANITTTAVLRTAEELQDLVQNCPFLQEEITAAQQANTEGESFYVCLLPQEPDAQTLEKMRAIEPSDDVFFLYRRSVFLLLRQSIRTSRLAIRLQKIMPNMTVRNWNTITKLLELTRLSSGG